MPLEVSTQEICNGANGHSPKAPLEDQQRTGVPLQQRQQQQPIQSPKESIDRSNSQNQAITHDGLTDLEASPQAWQIFWQDLRINASVAPQSQEGPVGHGKSNISIHKGMMEFG
nr:uncharacterized protein LOC118878212 [Drosophila suzukii]